MRVKVGREKNKRRGGKKSKRWYEKGRNGGMRATKETKQSNTPLRA